MQMIPLETDILDELHNIKAMVAFLGYAYNGNSTEMTEDMRTGGQIFFNYVENTINNLLT